MASTASHAAPTRQAVDGRHLRGLRTKDALADALLALLSEGELRPTAQRIAQRAGVSLRVVFHHFADLDLMFAAAADRQISQLLPALPPIPEGGPAEDRLRAFILWRTDLLERIAPVRRAALMAAPYADVVADRLHGVAEWKRNAETSIFAHELSTLAPEQRAEVTAALAAAAGFSAWETLRLHQKFTVRDARRIVARTVAAILGVAVAPSWLDSLAHGEVG